jgi:hypothetical protein
LCYRSFTGRPDPPGLIAILTPANLFTGVTACGLICWLSVWTDRRFLPHGLRTGRGLALLNFAAGLVFVSLGIKGYWDHSGLIAFFILLGTLGFGWLAGWALHNVRGSNAERRSRNL